MSLRLTFWLATAAVLSLTQVALGDTPCGNLKQADNLNFKGDRRWYYCKSSGDTSDNGCFIDAHPDGNGNVVLKRTTYNATTQKLQAVTFTVKDGNGTSTPGKNAVHVDVALSEDENCMVAVKCWGAAPFALFVCHTKEACQDDKYTKFLEEAIKYVESVDGMDKFQSKMMNYYNEERCKEE